MSSLNKTSAFIESQLPGFITNNPDYTLFVQFLERYYEFLELPGNPIYELRRSKENYDVNEARKNLLQYFKQKILPSFPEETELSTERIIKASRDFYAKKGTPDSFRFLFRVLYGQEVDVFFPKTNIFRASDGKWQIPQAIRISLGDQSYSFPGNVKVWAANSNVVSYFGTLSSTNLVANNMIRVGGEKRKVTAVNYTANSFNVDIRFANTTYSSTSGVIYESGNTVYRLLPSTIANFDFSLLNKSTAIGANSRTSCLIESASKTYDQDSGQEIAELYVSNVNREFEIGENINVNYIDTDGTTKTFSSKIVSLVSKVVLEKNRFNKDMGGNAYLSGDPVVFYGGLDKNTDQAKSAIAVVDEVSTGGIDVVRLKSPGYFFRTFEDGSLIQIKSESGVGANLTIDQIYTDAFNANSESFTYATDAIVYKKDIQLQDIDYEFENVTNIVGFTTGSGNTTTTVNINTATYLASAVSNYYKSYILTIIEGTGASASPNSAVILSYNPGTKRAVLSTPLAVAPDGTSKVKITANAMTEIGRAMSYETFIMGKIKQLDLVDVGAAFTETPTFEVISTFETDYSKDAGFEELTSGDFSNYVTDSFPYPTLRLNSSNPNFSTANGFYTGTRLFVDTGDNAHYATVVDYIVTDPNSTANVKTLFLDRKFESNITPLNINRFNLFFDYRANVQNTGKIGAVQIINGGTNYSSADVVNFIGSGIGGKAALQVDSSGKITNVIMVDRGAGYYGNGQTTAVVSNAVGGPSSGFGAEFFVWHLSDGEDITATVTDFGKIKTFDVLNRGYGYISKPEVSLKVLDIYSNTTLGLSNKLSVGDAVWQGNANISGADVTFTATVSEIYDVPDTSDSVIRVYDYNGTLANTTIFANTKTGYGNIVCNVSPVVKTISFKGVYDSRERTYPHFYGNGLAKAKAEFLNGLIKYDGYYLNTDGFPSADKRLQDSKYYHNYSYEIQSEKSLDEYRTTVFEVSHPAGMKLLGKFLMKDVINVNPQTRSNVCNSRTPGGAITVSSYTNGIGGSGLTSLAQSASVGDLILINSNASANQRYVRTITQVQLPPTTSVTMDEPIGNYGDGLLSITSGSAVAKAFANTYPLPNNIKVGDALQFSAAGTTNPAYFTVLRTIQSISGNTITFTTAIPGTIATQTVSYRIALLTLTEVPYKLIKTIG